MSNRELTATLAEVDLFRGLSHRVLSHIAESGHTAEYAEGATVIVQGESVTGFKAFAPSGVEMHVVLDGAVRIAIDTRRNVQRLGIEADVVADGGNVLTRVGAHREGGADVFEFAVREDDEQAPLRHRVVDANGQHTTHEDHGFDLSFYASGPLGAAVRANNDGLRR